MKVLKTFKYPVTVEGGRQSELRAALNLYYLGDEEVNVWTENGYVPKHPDKETPEFEEATFTLHRSSTVEVEFDLMEDGSIRLHEKD